jgi:hypothetical protein
MITMCASRYPNVRRGATLIVESYWFEFRTEALRQIVLDGCEEHHIAWE